MKRGAMNLQERGRAVLQGEREGHIAGRVEGRKGWEKCCHLSYNLKKTKRLRWGDNCENTQHWPLAPHEHTLMNTHSQRKFTMRFICKIERFRQKQNRTEIRKASRTFISWRYSSIDKSFREKHEKTIF